MQLFMKVMRSHSNQSLVILSRKFAIFLFRFRTSDNNLELFAVFRSKLIAFPQVPQSQFMKQYTSHCGSFLFSCDIQFSVDGRVFWVVESIYRQLALALLFHNIVGSDAKPCRVECGNSRALSVFSPRFARVITALPSCSDSLQLEFCEERWKIMSLQSDASPDAVHVQYIMLASTWPSMEVHFPFNLRNFHPIARRVRYMWTASPDQGRL